MVILGTIIEQEHTFALKKTAEITCPLGFLYNIVPPPDYHLAWEPKLLSII